MAESLLNKARVAMLGNLHKLLDRAVNTPEGFKQYIRQLEEAMGDLRSARDEVAGSVAGYRRTITELEGKRARLQADIDLLISDDDPDNDASAVELQVLLDKIDNQIVAQQELLAQADDDKAKLDDALQKLATKHSEMVTALQQVTLQAAATKAQNRAASAAERAMSAAGAGADASIDSVRQQIQRDNDTADARFERVFGEMSAQGSPEQVAELARAKEKLAARRQQIADEAQAATTR